MFGTNRLTYQKRNRLLLIAAVCFLLLVYQFAIRHTFDLRATNRELTKRLEKAELAPQKIQNYENKLQEINPRMGHPGRAGEVNQEFMLETVSGICQRRNITLKEFPKSSFTEGPSYTLETTAIVLEGDFINLLKLVYELEQNTEVGKVTSVKFLSFEDHKRKKIVLSLTIYLQHIKPKNAHEA